MKRFTLVAALGALLSVPMLVGCDRELSRHDSVKTRPDGTTVTNSDKTVQHPDGTVSRERDRSVNTDRTAP